MACVLVVDDDPAIRDLIAEILGRAGHAVLTASDGAQALDEVRRHVPDAILLDLAMPVMDGWQFLRATRGEPWTDAVPVAAMSTDRDETRRAAGLGARAFLLKPFGVGAVLRLVDGLTNQPDAGWN